MHYLKDFRKKFFGYLIPYKNNDLNKKLFDKKLTYCIVLQLNVFIY